MSSHPPGYAPPYLILKHPSLLQHALAGSLYLVLEAEQRQGALGQGLYPSLVLSGPHLLPRWPRGSSTAVSLPPFGHQDITYWALWVLGEDETVDMSHSHSIEHRAPAWTECTSNQGPEVELKEGQVVFRRLCIVLQGHRQLWREWDTLRVRVECLSLDDRMADGHMDWIMRAEIRFWTDIYYCLS